MLLVGLFCYRELERIVRTEWVSGANQAGDIASLSRDIGRLTILAKKPAKRLACGARQPMMVSATVAETGHVNPVADGLVAAVELSGEGSNRTLRPSRRHHLAAKLRRMRQMCSWHRAFSVPKGSSIRDSESM